MSQVWNRVENKISGQLACIDPNVGPEKWIETLVKLDEAIMATPSTSDDIFVISLPYTLNDTRKALHETEYVDDVCVDNIINFIAPNKSFIETIMSQNDESKEAFILNSNDPETDFKHFDASTYNELLSTQAVIIINIKEGSYVSIPRNVQQLSYEWYISWFGLAENATTQNIISKTIQSCLPNNFQFNKNWGKRTAEILVSSEEKLFLSEWHLNVSDSKPHSVVLLHSITSTKKSRRKLWVDGSEKYDNASRCNSFRIEIDKDVIIVNINYDEQAHETITYTLAINYDTFEDRSKKSRKKKMVFSGYGKKKMVVSKIYGKIQFVKHFPDYKVQVVNHFADLKVQKVNHFPNAPGKWQIVNHFPDYKIQIVNHFPDFKIQYVNHFPGVVKK